MRVHDSYIPPLKGDRLMILFCNTANGKETRTILNIVLESQKYAEEIA